MVAIGYPIEGRRILVIQPAIGQTGGGAVAQQCIIDSLRALGNETYTLSFFGDYPASHSKQHFTYSLRSASQTRAGKYSYNSGLIRFMRQVIDETKPEIIFVGQLWSFLSLVSVIRRLRIPLVHVVHSAEYGCLNSMLTQKDSMNVCSGGVGLKCRVHRCESSLTFLPKVVLHSLRNFLLKRYFTAFVCHSRFMLNFMGEQSFESLYYVPLNLPGEPAQSAALDVHREGPIELLFVGTLAWHKGIFDLIEAMRELSKERVDYHLNIVGDGPSRADVEDLIERHNLQGGISIHLEMERHLVADYYRRADVVVFPSYFESFGLVALEAMTYNKHLIVSNRGALLDTTSGYEKRTVLANISAPEIMRAIINVKNKLPEQASEQRLDSSPIQREYSPSQTMKKLRELLNDYELVECPGRDANALNRSNQSITVK